MKNVVLFLGGWDDKFLQQESELKRVRSEKVNLEQHILGMEGELETLHEESTKLKQEIETQRRASSGMEQHIERLTAEVNTGVCWAGYPRGFKSIQNVLYDCFSQL